MKKLLTLLMMFGFLFGFVACGGGASTSEAAEDAAEVVEEAAEEATEAVEEAAEEVEEVADSVAAEVEEAVEERILF